MKTAGPLNRSKTAVTEATASPWDRFIGASVRLSLMSRKQEIEGSVCDVDRGVLFIATAPEDSPYRSRFIAVPEGNIAILEKLEDEA